MRQRIKNIPEVSKGEKIFWWVVRAALIVCFFYSLFFLTNENHTLYKADGGTKLIQALAAFGLTFTWSIVQFFFGKTWLHNLSPRVQDCINAFILIGCCVCSYLYLYERWWFTDLLMHAVSGAITAVGAYEVLLAMQHNTKHHIEKATVVIWIFSLVIVIGCIWEVYEFTVDCILGSNMQIRFDRLIANWSSSGGRVTFYDAAGKVAEYSKGAPFTVAGKLTTQQLNSSLYDTMTDMIVAAIGGVIAEIVLIKGFFKKDFKGSKVSMD